MAAFPAGAIVGKGMVTGLLKLEAEIAVLAKDVAIARELKGIRIDMPALAQDGSLARRRDLVMPGKDTDRLALPKRFLLKSGAHAAALEELSAPLPKPSLSMLIAAFNEDAENFAALQARLSAFLDLSQPGDGYRSALAGLPILPVHGAAYAPRDLAFVGPHGDYWGSWKTRLSAKGLSQDDQRRYLVAGVTSATPSSETSRAFLEWMAGRTHQ